MIKTERYRLLWCILFPVILVIILAASGIHQSPNEEENLISNNKEVSFKLKNTKSIMICNPISSDSNSTVNISEPKFINQIENLFNKASFIKCPTQTPTRASHLFISFYNDSSSTSLFVCANDIIIDIEGTKYLSEDITFHAINTFYLKYKKGSHLK